MKRISILIMLAVLITVGGVYATWNYAQGSVSTTPENAEIMLAEKIDDISKGTITVDMSNFEILIDDAGQYVAEAVMSGEIVITFEAADKADADIIANGIAMQFKLSVTTPWEYEGTQIFTVDTNPVILNSGAPTFSVTIPASQLESLITIGDITLPTVDAYTAFETALSQGNITFTVSEVE